MSLVGLRAQNHPQQVARDHKSGNDRRWHSGVDADDRATTLDLFSELDERFGGFTVDVAAAAHNTKCARYYTVETNGLAQSWAAERVWCNPPYSDIRPWLAKAWHAWNWEQAETIVMLLPANRTEQRWWQDLVEPGHRGRWPEFSIEFLPGRIRFLKPGQTQIGPNERPPFGCCLLIWERIS